MRSRCSQSFVTNFFTSVIFAGRRYRRQDEAGTPLCVTLDFDTLEDDSVTVRWRDTMQQVRVPWASLLAVNFARDDFVEQALSSTLLAAQPEREQR